MIRIAIPPRQFGFWTGGRSFLEYVLRALHLVRDADQYAVVGLIEGDQGQFAPQETFFDEKHYVSGNARRLRTRAAEILMRYSTTRHLAPDSLLSRQMQEIQADVAFVKQSPRANFRVPTICWLPDFQYLHLPSMFSRDEIAGLERVYGDSARYSSRIFLTSESVKRDFVRHLPEFAGKASVLRPVACIDESLISADPGMIRRYYRLPEKFFYLPNQFWRHKNHVFVLEALLRATRIEPHITIVASGLLHDYRNPDYPSEFLAQIASSSLRENIVVLGLIPRTHVYDLMRCSLAVLQPSLFEGWSSTAEEAISLGKNMLISNLDVHLEKNAANARYFDPNEPQELADLLVETYRELKPGTNFELETSARANMLIRARKFGSDFLALCHQVASA